MNLRKIAPHPFGYTRTAETLTIVLRVTQIRKLSPPPAILLTPTILVFTRVWSPALKGARKKTSPLGREDRPMAPMRTPDGPVPDRSRRQIEKMTEGVWNYNSKGLF